MPGLALTAEGIRIAEPSAAAREAVVSSVRLGTGEIGARPRRRFYDAYDSAHGERNATYCILGLIPPDSRSDSPATLLAAATAPNQWLEDDARRVRDARS